MSETNNNFCQQMYKFLIDMLQKKLKNYVMTIELYPKNVEKKIFIYIELHKGTRIVELRFMDFFIESEIKCANFGTYQ